MQLIKFIVSTEEPEITAVDIGVLELKLAVTNLETSIERLQEQIEEYVWDLHVTAWI